MNFDAALRSITAGFASEGRKRNKSRDRKEQTKKHFMHMTRRRIKDTSHLQRLMWQTAGVIHFIEKHYGANLPHAFEKQIMEDTAYLRNNYAVLYVPTTSGELNPIRKTVIKMNRQYKFAYLDDIDASRVKQIENEVRLAECQGAVMMEKLTTFNDDIARIKRQMSRKDPKQVEDLITRLYNEIKEKVSLKVQTKIFSNKSSTLSSN